MVSTWTAATARRPPGDMVTEYASDYVSLPKNMSNTKAWRDAFVKHFAGAYGKYVDGSDRQVAMYEDAPAKASDCHTLESLRRWRAAQRAQVGTFIPRPYRTFGAGAVEQEYAENKARIEREIADAKAKAEAKAKADAKESEKKDDSTHDPPAADEDAKGTSGAAEPSLGAAASMLQQPQLLFAES